MIDTNSPVWEAVKQFAKQEQENIIKQILADGTPHDKAQHLRGQKAMIDKLLALPDRKEEAPLTTIPYE